MLPAHGVAKKTMDAPPQDGAPRELGANEFWRAVSATDKLGNTWLMHLAKTGEQKKNLIVGMLEFLHGMNNKACRELLQMTNGKSETALTLCTTDEMQGIMRAFSIDYGTATKVRIVKRVFGTNIIK